MGSDKMSLLLAEIAAINAEESGLDNFSPSTLESASGCSDTAMSWHPSNESKSKSVLTRIIDYLSGGPSRTLR